MTPVLDLTFLDNSVRAWIVAGVVAVAGFLLLSLFLVLVRSRLSKFAARTRTQWDDVFVLALGKTSTVFILILVISAASAFLTLPDRVRSAIAAISALAVVVQGGIWFSAAFTAWFSAHARRHHETDQRAAREISWPGFPRFSAKRSSRRRTFGSSGPISRTTVTSASGSRRCTSC